MIWSYTHDKSSKAHVCYRFSDRRQPQQIYTNACNSKLHFYEGTYLNSINRISIFAMRYNTKLGFFAFCSSSKCERNSEQHTHNLYSYNNIQKSPGRTKKSKTTSCYD